MTSKEVPLNGYRAVNSEKTIFKKTKGSDYIIHNQFVDKLFIPPHVRNILKTLKSQVEASQRHSWEWKWNRVARHLTCILIVISSRSSVTPH